MLSIVKRSLYSYWIIIANEYVNTCSIHDLQGSTVAHAGLQAGCRPVYHLSYTDRHSHLQTVVQSPITNLLVFGLQEEIYAENRRTCRRLHFKSFNIVTLVTMELVYI